MIRNPENKRINAIKIKRPLSWKTCRCCGMEYKKEPMFMFKRWGINQSVHEWWYCNHCMNSKEDVLNEIDSDINIFGIAFVDDFFRFQKKDRRKIDELRDRFTKQMQNRNIKTDQ